MIWFGSPELAITAVLIFEVALTVMLNTWDGRENRRHSYHPSRPHIRRIGPVAVSARAASGCAAIDHRRVQTCFSAAGEILIVAEMLVSVNAGLGYRIYWAREYLQSDIVYGGLLVVGIVGLLIERVFLRMLEVATVQRWGVMRELK